MEEDKFPYTLQETVRELGDFVPEKTDKELFNAGEIVGGGQQPSKPDSGSCECEEMTWVYPDANMN